MKPDSYEKHYGVIMERAKKLFEDTKSINDRLTFAEQFLTYRTDFPQESMREIADTIAV